MPVVELVGNSAILVYVAPTASHEPHIDPFNNLKVSKVIWNLATGYRLKRLRKGKHKRMRKAK